MTTTESNRRHRCSGSRGRAIGIYRVRSLARRHLGRLGPLHPEMAAAPALRELLNDLGRTPSRLDQSGRT
jgi:hypothetical protein